MQVPSDFTWPKTFSVRHFDGLLACELVTPANGTRVIAFWKSAKAASLSQGTLARELGGTVLWVGDVADLKKSPWRTKSAADFVLRLSATIGALAVIGAAMSTWFALPDVAFAVHAPQPIDVARGETFRFDVTLTNHSRTATTVDVRVTRPASVQVLQPRITIPAGGQTSVAVTGELVGEESGPIDLVADSKAGWIVPNRSYPFVVGVQVWPDISYQSFELVRANQRSATLRGAVAVGDTTTASVECLLSIGSAPVGTRFRSVTPSIRSTGGTPSVSPGDDLAISIEWAMPMRQPFRWHTINANLESLSGHTPEQWRELSTRAEFICDRLDASK
jgi:hypothetical protein